jgi:hypothetical protein
LLDDPASRDYGDFVHVLNGRQPVGDRDRGSPGAAPCLLKPPTREPAGLLL